MKLVQMWKEGPRVKLRISSVLQICSFEIFSSAQNRLQQRNLGRVTDGFASFSVYFCEFLLLREASAGTPEPWLRFFRFDQKSKCF